MSLSQSYPLFDKVVLDESASKLVSINLGVLILSLILIAVAFFMDDKYPSSHSLTKNQSDVAMDHHKNGMD